MDKFDRRRCAYYRGVGTCSFGCQGPNGPDCMELGKPTPGDLIDIEADGLPVSEWFRKAATP